MPGRRCRRPLRPLGRERGNPIRLTVGAVGTPEHAVDCDLPQGTGGRTKGGSPSAQPVYPVHRRSRPTAKHEDGATGPSGESPSMRPALPRNAVGGGLLRRTELDVTRTPTLTVDAARMRGARRPHGRGLCATENNRRIKRRRGRFAQDALSTAGCYARWRPAAWGGHERRRQPGWPSHFGGIHRAAPGADGSSIRIVGPPGLSTRVHGVQGQASGEAGSRPLGTHPYTGRPGPTADRGCTTGTRAGHRRRGSLPRDAAVGALPRGTMLGETSRGAHHRRRGRCPVRRGLWATAKREGATGHQAGHRRVAGLPGRRSGGPSSALEGCRRRGHYESPVPRLSGRCAGVCG